MNAADLHRKLDDALALLEVAEKRFAAEQARHRRPNEPAAIGNLRARDTQEMRDCMADWQLAHQRIQSYAAAAMAKDLAEFLRPQVDDLDFRDCHAAVPRSDEVELIPMGRRR